jgi:hypothetical protein
MSLEGTNDGAAAIQNFQITSINSASKYPKHDIDHGWEELRVTSVRGTHGEWAICTSPDSLPHGTSSMNSSKLDLD